MDSTVVFAHERLAVYRRTCEFLTGVRSVLEGLPRGEAHLADQLRRAGDSVLLNLCEGAGRTGGADKAKFYDIARGSGTECAAILAVCAIRDLAAASEIARLRRLLAEVVAMLTALARNARGRVPPT